MGENSVSKDLKNLMTANQLERPILHECQCVSFLEDFELWRTLLFVAGSCEIFSAVISMSSVQGVDEGRAWWQEQTNVSSPRRLKAGAI